MNVEVFAQGTITGVVTDSETGDVVIGAYVSSGTETVATDFYGGYSITLPAGTHTLKCSFIGMGDTSKEFGINDGESLVWDIVLQPEAKS